MKQPSNDGTSAGDVDEITTDITADITADITVVTVNYNRCDDLREALLSVRAQDHPRFRVVVVDNASQDGSVAMVCRDFPEVEVLAQSENLGMAGYAVGFAHAQTELLFQMDNDSLMPDGSVLSEVARRFAVGGEQLGGVACRVEEFRDGHDCPEDLRARDARRGPLVTGGFHAGGVGFRRAAFDGVGSYSQEVFLYGSELFVQMKLLARGFEIHYFPEILMLHKSSGAARSARALYYEVRNRYWFMRCFADRRQRLRFLPAMLLHDAAYALFKRRPLAFTRAVRDGFGPLPADLRSTGHCSQPALRAKVDEVGASFSLDRLVHRTGRRVLG